MDDRSLNAFLQLAETLHFGRASEACHMSPSTLSRTIKQLEQSLGVRLFERDNRRVALTPEGALYRQYARESALLWETFQTRLMDETRELAGEIRMYCSVTASYSFLYELLNDFRRLHPKIRIQLHTGDPEQAVGQVLTGDAEISIGARPQRMPSALAFKPIAVSPLVFIAPRDETAIGAPPTRNTRPSRWARIPMIVPERGLARDRLDGWCQAKGIRPRIWAQVAGNEAIVSMVALGGGVGVVPRIVLENSPLAGRVTVVDARPELAPLEVGLFVLRKRLGNRLIDAFWSSIERADGARSEG